MGNNNQKQRDIRDKNYLTDNEKDWPYNSTSVPHHYLSSNKQMLFNPDLEFYISSALDRNMVMDVGNADPTGQMYLWIQHGGKNQRYKIKQQNGKYILYSSLGSAIQVPFNSTQDGVHLSATRQKNIPSIQWNIVEAEGSQQNLYYITSFCGKALDVSGASKIGGAKIIQYTFHGGDNQKWFIEPVNEKKEDLIPECLFSTHSDYFILSALDQSMALDASQGEHNRNKMILWKKHGLPNQRFKIQYFSGKYGIYCQNLSLQVQNASNDTQAFVKFPTTAPQQYWNIQPVPGRENAYYIKSFCGKALDVAGFNKNPGGKVIQWDFHGHDNQVWFIYPA